MSAADDNSSSSTAATSGSLLWEPQPSNPLLDEAVRNRISRQEKCNTYYMGKSGTTEWFFDHYTDLNRRWRTCIVSRTPSTGSSGLPSKEQVLEASKPHLFALKTGLQGDRIVRAPKPSPHGQSKDVLEYLLFSAGDRRAWRTRDSYDPSYTLATPFFLPHTSDPSYDIQLKCMKALETHFWRQHKEKPILLRPMRAFSLVFSQWIDTYWFWTVDRAPGSPRDMSEVASAFEEWVREEEHDEDHRDDTPQDFNEWDEETEIELA